MKIEDGIQEKTGTAMRVDDEESRLNASRAQPVALPIYTANQSRSRWSSTCARMKTVPFPARLMPALLFRTWIYQPE